MSSDRRWPPDPFGTGAPPDSSLGFGPPPDSLLGGMDAEDLFDPNDRFNPDDRFDPDNLFGPAGGGPARAVSQPVTPSYTQPMDAPISGPVDPAVGWTAEQLLGLPLDRNDVAPTHLYGGPVPPPLRSASGPMTPERAVTPRTPRGPRLRVDWPACRAHGLCVELLPERLRLDEWGYPIVDSTPVTPELMEVARRAAASCPTLALRIIDPP